MAFPELINPGSPLGSDSPAFGDDEFRALKQYIVDVYGAPNNLSVTAGAFTVATTGHVTVLQSPITLPTVAQGGVSQILRIESQYSGLEFRGPGSALLATMTRNGLSVVTNTYTGGRYFAGAGIIPITTPTGMLDLTKLSNEPDWAGDLATRGASNWYGFHAGTSGFLLQSQGTGANLIWADPVAIFGSGGGGGSSSVSGFGSSAVLAVVTPLFANIAISDIVFNFDGNSAPITAGLKGDIALDFNARINQVTLLGYPTGSMVVNIYRSPYASYPGGVSQAITGSAKPTLSAGIKYQDNSLTGWTTAINAGDILRINVDSVASVILAGLSLKITKTFS